MGHNKRQAELALKKVEVSIAENNFFDVRKKPKFLFRKMAEEYIEKYSRVSKKSFGKDENIIKRFNSFFGGQISL